MMVMSDIVDAGIKRLECEDESVTAGQIRKRGVIKAVGGLLVFSATLIAVMAYGAVQLASREDPLGPVEPPSFWQGLLNRVLAIIVGTPMVIGLFAMIFGTQQAVLGRPWNKIPLVVRVLVLAIGIPAVFAAVLFAVFTLGDLWFD
jgi:hypothetical protein